MPRRQVYGYRPQQSRWGAYLGGLLGGKGRVLELRPSKDSAGYRRGLSVRRKVRGKLRPALRPPCPPPSAWHSSPYSLRCSVPRGPLPGLQAGLASSRLLPGTGVAVSCWRGGLVRREDGPGLWSRRPQGEGRQPCHLPKSESRAMNTAKQC